jgi:TRAP-type C4-dicarboxylate transport system permease small subunit
MAAMSFLGLAHTFKRGEMIRVGLLLERLDGWKRQVLEVLSHGVALAFIAFFAWQAGKLARDSWLLSDMSTGVISIPLWIPQIALVLGLGLLAVALLDELVHVLKGNRPSYEKPPPKDVDELLKRVTEGGGV